MDYAFGEMISPTIQLSIMLLLMLQTSSSHGGNATGLFMVELYASQVDGQISCIKSSRFIHAVKFLMHKNCGWLNLAKVSNQAHVCCWDGICFFVVQRDVFHRSVVNPQYV